MVSLRVCLWRCVAVVKSLDQSNKDDASNSSSDYEDPEEKRTPQPVISTTGDDDDVYEDVNNGPVSQQPATLPAAAAAAEDDLIYECCDELTSPSTASGDDYANMFYGRWDNAASDDRELSFRRGDVLMVVSRQFDEFGWWVGSLNGAVGLVPRDYLTPAYQRVNA